ncbi:hypothetical protein ACFT25_20920 [Streptomyces hydrogenans]|uniref:hypothetical protein n=1 Tax=Streptomyces hydrogenans TaxID=1873719 RepID=UPI0036427A1E
MATSIMLAAALLPHWAGRTSSTTTSKRPGCRTALRSPPRWTGDALLEDVRTLARDKLLLQGDRL